MRPIPIKLREILSNDPLFDVCIHREFPGHQCNSRITFEHAFIYAGKQVNEAWAIVPVCRAKNNDCTGESKAFNRFVSLYRLFRWDGDYFNDQQIKYLHFDFKEMFKFLAGRFYITDKVLGMKLVEEDCYLHKLGLFGSDV